MSSWIIISNRVIQHIRISIPTLRICLVRNNAIRLQESVDIRRTRLFYADKNKLIRCGSFALAPMKSAVLTRTPSPSLRHPFAIAQGRLRQMTTIRGSFPLDLKSSPSSNLWTFSLVYITCKYFCKI